MRVCGAVVVCVDEKSGVCVWWAKNREGERDLDGCMCRRV